MPPRKDLVALDPEEALDRLYRDAVDGASEQWLAAEAGVTLAQVRRWKQTVGIAAAAQGRRDKRSAAAAQKAALQGLTEHYEPARHRTREHLDFETPAFVVREPLDYTQYARACFMLEAALSFTPAQIASATGTRERDVETALLLWRRHLGRKGKACLGCAMLLDDRFGSFCSKSCHDRALRTHDP